MILPPPQNKYDRIAFFGPMASGKSYCANLLIEGRGYNKVSFAGKLKEIAADLFEVTGKDREGRRILQELGSLVREIQRDAWINYALKHIEDPTKKLVIDDLRYVNEAYALKQEGFIIVRAFVPESVRQERINNLYPDTDPTAFKHSSEVELWMIDADLYINSITLESATTGLLNLLDGVYDG